MKYRFFHEQQESQFIIKNDVRRVPLNQDEKLYDSMRNKSVSNQKKNNSVEQENDSIPRYQSIENYQQIIRQFSGNPMFQPHIRSKDKPSSGVENQNAQIEEEKVANEL